MAKIRKPELLAPAGSADSFRAAIENGADAIYLGTQEFSARHYAENFTSDQLSDLVAEAHKRAVKVYLTVNTILNDQEMETYPSYLYQAAQSGVDALIVQDPGVIYITRKMLPEMPLHASTQMTVHNSAGVIALANMGFSRVVLARETSLADIKQINQKSPVELEMFAHGALCISYSGICYLSSMIGGRSGNRGRCAQPCRLPYQLHESRSELAKNSKGQDHLLSTKDLRMIEYIPEIIDANVTSLKLEGRMKRPEYVAVITESYRKAIDSYFENQAEFSVDPQVLRELDQTFSRGASSGHYFGRLNKDSMTFDKPNHAGTLLGKVVAFKKGQAVIKLSATAGKNDGYLINTADGEIHGTLSYLADSEDSAAVASPGTIITVDVKGRVKPGDLVYKTRDSQLNRRARDTFASEKVSNRMDIYVSLIVKQGEAVRYEVTSADGISVSGQGNEPAQEALKRPLTMEVVTAQLSRLGNTGFVLKDLTADIQGSLMIPLKELNAIRKDFVAKLEQKRQQGFTVRDLPDLQEFSKRKPVLKIQPSDDTRKKLAVAVRTTEALQAAVSEGADIVYLYLNAYRPDAVLNSRELQQAAAICDQKTELVFVLPAIIKENRIAYYQNLLGGIAGSDTVRIALPTIGHFGVAGQKSLPWDYSAEYTMNGFNSYALEWIRMQGAKRCTLSPELSLTQIKAFKDVAMEKEVIVQGNFPLLTAAYCPKSAVCGCPEQKTGKSSLCEGSWYFKDRKKYHFPIYSDYECHMYLYNAKELSLYRDLERMIQAPVKILRIEAGIDTITNISLKTRMYREQLDNYHQTGKVSITEKNIEKMSRLAEHGQTSGHLFRGVE